MQSSGQAQAMLFMVFDFPADIAERGKVLTKLCLRWMNLILGPL